MKTNTIRTDQTCPLNLLFGATTLVVAIAAAAATPAVAQVFDDNLELTTQTQVDHFAYTEVTGYLRVRDDGSDPITNLDGLSRLTSVEGLLSISSNDSLTDVDGLSGLTAVGEDLRIVGNDSLTNVDGLSSLTSVGRSLDIRWNDSLTNVDGLSGLTSVGSGLLFDGLRIFHNDSLTNVDGLSGLTSVRGFLDIDFNDSLTELCGLYPLLAAGGLAGDYSVFENAANPTADDILNGGPCDPADAITELFAEHAITKVEARTLLQLADESLEELADLLTVFVEDGTLTPSEAQLLFVIAWNWQAI